MAAMPLEQQPKAFGVCVPTFFYSITDHCPVSCDTIYMHTAVIPLSDIVVVVALFATIYIKLFTRQQYNYFLDGSSLLQPYL